MWSEASYGFIKNLPQLNLQQTIKNAIECQALAINFPISYWKHLSSN